MPISPGDPSRRFKSAPGVSSGVKMEKRNFPVVVSVQEGAIAFAVSLVVPLAMCAAGAGAQLKVLFPALACLVAAILFFRRSPWYIGLCLWLFCSTPLIRRLIDVQAGWDPSNPVLLAPYLACALAGLSALRLFAGMPGSSRHSLPYLIMLGCIGYGFILAVLGDRAASGLVDGMKWSSGPLVALHVIYCWDLRAEHRKVLTFSLMIAVPLMALYGIAQFVNPAYWDIEWMENVKSLGLDSIGTPRPFDVRVFSTMNSPGSFGAMLAFGILLAFQARTLFMLPVTILGVMALMLTQYRSVWAATFIGVVYLIASDAGRIRGRVVGIGVTLLLVLCLTGAVPQMRNVVLDRFQTLSALNADESGADRLDQYVQFVTGDVNNSETLIVGEGLASFGAFRILDKRSWVGTDSGLIEIYSVFGIIIGTIFLLCLVKVILSVFLCKNTHEARLGRAAMVALIVLIPFGSIFIGESGFCAWLLLGLAAATLTASEADDQSPQKSNAAKGIAAFQ